MSTTQFDAAVIGSGQAGPFLAARLAAAGRRVVLIEREHLGGTCVNDGCMPTKAMIASARAAHIARRAADFGVRVGGPVSVDMAAVKARKDRIVGQAVGNLERWLAGIAGLSVVRGEARFVGPRTLAVGAETITAAQVFVNVGGRPALPAWPGLDRVPVLTNTSILELERVPEHLIVAGASYIGLEFAQMFRRFGARVTVLDTAARIVAREDADVSRTLQAILEREGIGFVLGIGDVAVAPAAAGVRLSLRADGRAETIDGSDLLVAVGRRPNTERLGLDRAGVATDERGFIVVDERLQTTAPGVWALGDVNGRGAFTHTAYNDHEIVAANLLDGADRRVGDRIPAYALFTDPPLGRVGLTEAAVRASGRPALVGVLPMQRVGRAKERGETDGFMKVLVDAQTRRIVGAALLCIEADEIVHSLLGAMAAGVTVDHMRRTVPIHPTVSELIPTLLDNLAPLGAATETTP